MQRASCWVGVEVEAARRKVMRWSVRGSWPECDAGFRRHIQRKACMIRAPDQTQPGWRERRNWERAGDKTVSCFAFVPGRREDWSQVGGRAVGRLVVARLCTARLRCSFCLWAQSDRPSPAEAGGQCGGKERSRGGTLARWHAGHLRAMNWHGHAINSIYEFLGTATS